MPKGIPKNGINKGQWKKGQVSPRKGVVISSESKEKMRLAHLGKKLNFSKTHRENLSKALRGKSKPSLKGKKRPPFSEEWKRNIKLGIQKRFADRSLLKKREDRKSQSYTDWQKAIRQRDNNECKMINSDCNGILECHHILSWREHPELRYDINNGILLCKYHHPRKYVEEKRLSPYFISLIIQNK